MADSFSPEAVINPLAGAHQPGTTDTDNTASETAIAPDVSLLQRCQAGEQRAWAALFAERTAQVYRWAVLLGLPPAEAEDAAQEVLATAIRRIDRCRAQEAMTSWLYQITRRVVANHRRLSWFRRWLPGAEPEQPGIAFEHATRRDAELELDVRRCLAGLPRGQAEVLALIDIEGYTREETARMLALPPGTVASRLRLARRAFRAGWEQAVEPTTTDLSWGKP